MTGNLLDLCFSSQNQGQKVNKPDKINVIRMPVRLIIHFAFVGGNTCTMYFTNLATVTNLVYLSSESIWFPSSSQPVLFRCVIFWQIIQNNSCRHRCQYTFRVLFVDFWLSLPPAWHNIKYSPF